MTEWVKKPWGGYKVLGQGPTHMTKTLTVLTGHATSLQCHEHRDEVWVSLGPGCEVTLNERTFNVPRGGHVFVPRGTWHRIRAPKEPVIIIETWIGDYLSEDDIVRKEDDYGRA